MYLHWVMYCTFYYFAFRDLYGVNGQSIIILEKSLEIKEC